MPSITMPPESEDFTADPSELYFDLAYVFAFAQIVSVIAHHPDWEHLGKMALLFILMWLPWQQFTWAANAVPGNTRPVRFFILIGTVISIPMAASIATAFGVGGLVFAVSVVLISLLGLSLQLVGFDRDSAVYASSVKWALVASPSLLLLLVGGFADEGPRLWLWVAAAVYAAIATFIGGRMEWAVRPGHFAERHGLITIVAIGEVVAAIGVAGAEALVESVEGSALAVDRTIYALVTTGLFAGLLWWGYFDQIGPALEHRIHSIDDRLQRGRMARTIYTWEHLLIVGGVMLCAAALEKIAIHPIEVPATEYRSLIVGGAVTMMVGYTLVVWTAFRAIPWERVAATAIFTALCLPPSLPLIGDTNGYFVLLTADVLMLIVFVAEYRRVTSIGSLQT